MKKSTMEMRWNLTKSGKLTIQGAGKIPDCGGKSLPPAPWEEWKDEIVTLVIGEGITEIGLNAFRECKNLRRVVFPNSLRRIHAGVFWNCSRLEQIESSCIAYKYVYEPQEEGFTVHNYIVFGIGSFFNVPWAIKKWGNFYCRDNRLYACFSSDKHLVLSEGIIALTQFSLANLDIDSIQLPNTLKFIEEYAFLESQVKNMVYILDTVIRVDSKAFFAAKVPAVSFPAKWERLMSWEEKKDFGDILEFRHVYPAFRDRFSLVSRGSKRDDRFRHLVVVENKKVCHKDGSVTDIRKKDTLEVWKRLYRRIKINDQVIVHIVFNEEKVLCLETFRECGMGRLTCTRLLVQQRDGIEVCTELEEEMDLEMFRTLFSCLDGQSLVKNGIKIVKNEDVREEWYCWSEGQYSYKKKRSDFIKSWLYENPGIDFRTAPLKN